MGLRIAGIGLRPSTRKQASGSLHVHARVWGLPVTQNDFQSLACKHRSPALVSMQDILAALLMAPGFTQASGRASGRYDQRPRDTSSLSLVHGAASALQHAVLIAMPGMQEELKRCGPHMAHMGAVTSAAALYRDLCKHGILHNLLLGQVGWFEDPPQSAACARLP